MNNRTVLITGGCGFIGVNIARFLHKRGFKIKILDNFSTGKKENLSEAGLTVPPVSLIVGDIRDQHIVDEAIGEAEVVVHLAAHTRVIESMAKPLENWEINTKGTANLLEASRNKGVKKF